MGNEGRSGGLPSLGDAGTEQQQLKKQRGQQQKRQRSKSSEPDPRTNNKGNKDQMYRQRLKDNQQIKDEEMNKLQEENNQLKCHLDKVQAENQQMKMQMMETKHEAEKQALVFQREKMEIKLEAEKQASVHQAEKMEIKLEAEKQVSLFKDEISNLKEQLWKAIAEKEKNMPDERDNIERDVEILPKSTQDKPVQLQVFANPTPPVFANPTPAAFASATSAFANPMAAFYANITAFANPKVQLRGMRHSGGKLSENDRPRSTSLQSRESVNRPNSSSTRVLSLKTVRLTEEGMTMRIQSREETFENMPMGIDEETWKYFMDMEYLAPEILKGDGH